MLAYPVDEARENASIPWSFPKPDAGLLRALRDGAGCRSADIPLPGSLSCPL